MPEHEEPFLSLINEHRGIIHKICRLYRDRVEDREDLFQEITFQLWKAYPSFRGEARAATWLYRIALNTAMSSFRKKKLAILYTDTLPDVAEAQPGEDMALRQERFFAAMRQCSDSEKAILALHLEELNYKQIAEITGLSENHVGVKLNRIKMKIKKLIQ